MGHLGWGTLGYLGGNLNTMDQVDSVGMGQIAPEEVDCLVAGN